MEVLIVNQEEVAKLMPMDACMDAMAGALKILSAGDAIMPLRQAIWLPEKFGALGLMPAIMDDIESMGIKVVSVMPGNHGTEYDSHQGAVLLFETNNGRMLAMIDASEITAIRTAAASGVATRLLARAAADDLAILGSGVQARSHLEAMLVAREIKRVRVWSRTLQNAQAFAEKESQRHGIEIEVPDSVEAAVDGADIICTTTSAREPILMGDSLAPGSHINAAGSSVSFTRELDTAAVVKSSLFVDRRESTLNEAGDFLMPKAEGAIGDDHIRAEIGEILLGKHPGRERSDEITLFKSLGVGVEDLAAAHLIYNSAIEKGMGTSIEFGGGR